MTRILLVEDSADILFVLQTELEWYGYTVVAATDADSALDAARRSPPDLIISDLRMPYVDGYEFIGRIRAIPELAGIPAIALTGCGTTREIQRALGAGFTTHAMKPVDGKALADMARRLTGKPGNAFKVAGEHGHAA